MSRGFGAWCEGDVLADVFDTYTYGYSDDKDGDIPLLKSSNRTRKVTISEITDDEFSFDESSGSDQDEEELDADELHKAFESVVEDWKIKMEVIIGDGLKKLRKSNKERKLMMKYLPQQKGNPLAKKSVAKEWKIDFQKAFGVTHKKLEKLAADKTKQVERIVKIDMKETNQDWNRNKKTVINIDCKESRGSPDNYAYLKELIKELDKMCNILQQGENGYASPTMQSIPIYSKEARSQVLPAYNNSWLELQRNMFLDNDLSVYLRNRQNFLNCLEDFKVKYTKESNQDGINSKGEDINEKLAMNESNLGEKHVLKQIKTKEGERFLIVKKKDPIKAEVEDIFHDWNRNLIDIFEQRKLAALAAKNNRKRKLSNRAARKELIKTLNQTQAKVDPGTFSYADIVKRNLKPSMEDIFEAWKDYLQELDDILSENSRTSFSKGDSAEDILKTAKSFQRELQQCGQPTVKSAKKQSPFILPLKKAKNAQKFAPEMIFASWRQNLAHENACNPGQKSKYDAENYFASWKHNLVEMSKPTHNQDEECDVIFADWVDNLNDDYQVAAKETSSRNESKMLKNKQRQQRRSKKKANF